MCFIYIYASADLKGREREKNLCGRSVLCTAKKPYAAVGQKERERETRGTLGGERYAHTTLLMQREYYYPFADLCALDVSMIGRREYLGDL